MDSWTPSQLRVFDHGGNRRLKEFFAANSVPGEPRFQRYNSHAATWYRESWIKNSIFDKDVPPPPAGVVYGPCMAGATSKTTPAAADLLDFGGASSAPTGAGDLLSFDEKPAPAAKGGAMEDLLGMGTASTAAPTASAGD